MLIHHKLNLLSIRLPLLAALLGALLLTGWVVAPAHAQDTGLVGYWPFDEGTGQTSADLSGSGNTATMGIYAHFSPNSAPTEFANPYAFTSIRVSSSYATAPGNNIDNLQQFTVSFWMRLNQLPSNSSELLIQLGNKAQFWAYFTNVPIFSFTVNTGGSDHSNSTTQNLMDGHYHHVVGMFDGVHSYLFVDGIGAGGVTLFGAVAPGAGVSFGLPGAPLDGELDDVRIYNRPLSAAEIASLATFGCTNLHEIPVSECTNLLGLYNNLDGRHWTNHALWALSSTPCSWYGVFCQDGHVIAINLPGNNLTGQLPPLSGLQQMLVLNLAGNHLNGAVPYEIGDLAKLVTLDLYNNQLSDSLPPSLGSLTKLQTLRVQNNHLRGNLPAQLASLNNLTTLDVSYNLLTAADANLIAALNRLQPAWAATQTLPPTNLQARATSHSSVALTWTPISYTADSGYYDVLAMLPSSGTFQSVGKTADKIAASLTITGLTPDAAYTFIVRTVTPKHGDQANDLASDTTDPVTVDLAQFTNHAPVAIDDNYAYSMTAGSSLTVDAAHGLLANDSDLDGNPLTVLGSHSNPAHGILALAVDGSFVYTPTPGYNGLDTFTYQASDGQAASNTATVTLTIVAASPATITIVLDAQPDAKTNFAFGGNLGVFTLDDITPQDSDAYTNSASFTTPAGVYTVTAALPAGWSFANISCNPGDNTLADLGLGQLTVNAAGGANITCTFVVQRNGEIVAGSYNDHNHNHIRDRYDEWLSGWQMQLHNGLSGETMGQTTNSEGRAVFGNLRPGNYTVCEAMVTGWYNITPGTIDVNLNQPCYTVTVAPGKSVWTRFGNSTTPLAAAASAQAFEDIVICDLPALDDAGQATEPARDPWEEEEAATANSLFLPMVVHD